jgi:histone demethylase JARID1
MVGRSHIIASEHIYHFNFRLIDSLKEMVDREMGGRAYARSLGIGELLEEEDRPEDQYQCTICKMFCYLSQITCQCKSEVVCVDHAEFLCDHPVSQLIMRKRFSDTDLLETLNKVSERASLPAVWRGKLNKLLKVLGPSSDHFVLFLLREIVSISLFPSWLHYVNVSLEETNGWTLQTHSLFGSRAGSAPAGLEANSR